MFEQHFTRFAVLLTLVGAAAASARDITVPAGHVQYLKVAAEGTQNYVCLPDGNGGLAWKFQGPQAALFITQRWFTGDIKQQVGTHYLCASVTEPGTPARATWMNSIDSRIWAGIHFEMDNRAR